MNARMVIAAFAVVSWPCSAHRLDEYLQATTISLDRNRIEVEMRLIPGVAVVPFVLKTLDRNGDRTISDSEQNAYIDRLRNDIKLTLDGRTLLLRLTSKTFPPVEEMEEGRGVIQAAFEASIEAPGSSRELRFENRHWRPIGAYLVNVIVPGDPNIKIVAQTRNFDQSSYRLTYSVASESHVYTWFAAAAVLTFVRIASRRRFV